MSQTHLDKWVSPNKLKLNKDKSELLYLYSKHGSITSLPLLRFRNDKIHPSASARNIGAMFADSTMSMLLDVNFIGKSA